MVRLNIELQNVEKQIKNPTNCLGKKMNRLKMYVNKYFYQGCEIVL
jgi:hypothetical protein